MLKILFCTWALVGVASMAACQDAGNTPAPGTPPAPPPASVPVAQTPAVAHTSTPVPSASTPSSPNKPAPAASPAAPAKPASRPASAPKPAASSKNLVKVPLLQGCDLGYEQKLLRAGLKPRPIAVHGPEPDSAGLETGCPYRVQPKPGTPVAPGTPVTYRAWWEQADSQ